MFTSRSLVVYFGFDLSHIAVMNIRQHQNKKFWSCWIKLLSEALELLLHQVQAMEEMKCHVHHVFDGISGSKKAITVLKMMQKVEEL